MVARARARRARDHVREPREHQQRHRDRCDQDAREQHDRHEDDEHHEPGLGRYGGGDRDREGGEQEERDREAAPPRGRARRKRGQVGGQAVEVRERDGAVGGVRAPGESYLALLDGLYEHRDTFRIVNCRHEAAAANAADAYGKLTGRPGICMVTRGPGATHAATGIHTARQDSTPLILLVGQVARAERGRESFQELDYEAVFGPMAKWAFELDDPARIPEVLARAYAVATSGRPGPVVLALPEDVLAAEVEVDDAPRYRAVRPAPSAEALEELGALLE